MPCNDSPYKVLIVDQCIAMWWNRSCKPHEVAWGLQRKIWENTSWSPHPPIVTVWPWPRHPQLQKCCMTIKDATFEQWLRLQLAMLQLHIGIVTWCWPLSVRLMLTPVRSPMLCLTCEVPYDAPRLTLSWSWFTQTPLPLWMTVPDNGPISFLTPLPSSAFSSVSCRPITFSPLLQNCFNFGAECWVTPFARWPPPWLQIYGSSHCQPIFTSLIIINVIIILDQTISEQPSDHHHCQSSKSWFVLASKGSTFKIHVSSIAPFIKEWPSSP